MTRKLIGVFVFLAVMVLGVGAAPAAEASEREDATTAARTQRAECVTLSDRSASYSLEGRAGTSPTLEDNTIQWQNGSSSWTSGSSSRIISGTLLDASTYAVGNALKGDITAFGATLIGYINAADSAAGVGGSHFLAYRMDFTMHDDGVFSSTSFNSRQQVVNGLIPPPTSSAPTLTILDSTGVAIATPDIASPNGNPYSYMATPDIALAPGDYTMELVLTGSRQVHDSWANSPGQQQGTITSLGYQVGFTNTGGATEGIGLDWKLRCPVGEIPDRDDLPFFAVDDDPTGGPILGVPIYYNGPGIK